MILQDSYPRRESVLVLVYLDLQVFAVLFAQTVNDYLQHPETGSNLGSTELIGVFEFFKFVFFHLVSLFSTVVLLLSGICMQHLLQAWALGI